MKTHRYLSQLILALACACLALQVYASDKDQVPENLAGILLEGGELDGLTVKGTTALEWVVEPRRVKGGERSGPVEEILRLPPTVAEYEGGISQVGVEQNIQVGKLTARVQLCRFEDPATAQKAVRNYEAGLAMPMSNGLWGKKCTETGWDAVWSSKDETCFGALLCSGDMCVFVDVLQSKEVDDQTKREVVLAIVKTILEKRSSGTPRR